MQRSRTRLWTKGRAAVTPTSFPGPFPWLEGSGKRPWERGCCNTSLNIFETHFGWRVQSEWILRCKNVYIYIWMVWPEISLSKLFVTNLTKIRRNLFEDYWPWRRMFTKLKILVRRAQERKIPGLSTNRQGLKESQDDSENNKISKQWISLFIEIWQNVLKSFPVSLKKGVQFGPNQCCYNKHDKNYNFGHNFTNKQNESSSNNVCFLQPF